MQLVSFTTKKWFHACALSPADSPPESWPTGHSDRKGWLLRGSASHTQQTTTWRKLSVEKEREQTVGFGGYRGILRLVINKKNGRMPFFTSLNSLCRRIPHTGFTHIGQRSMTFPVYTIVQKFGADKIFFLSYAHQGCFF